mmetsp:Transcript_36032/g.35638  ORF Transcript_36032/g.35638 Transcript_36032/m.35638 type:complete len:258 (-) Transcript_36032:15-788(-)
MDSKTKRRKHFATNKNLDAIKIEDISANHTYKIGDFKDIPLNHQIVLLCPTRSFLSMNQKFSKMKEIKEYDKYLFKPLEDNVNLIYRANFEADFMKTMIWNMNFNKTITDANQYLFRIRSTDTNIFKKILHYNKRSIAEINEKKKRTSNTRKLSNAKESLLRNNQSYRSRRLVSVSTSFTANSKEFEEIMRQKNENRRGASRKNTAMNYFPKGEDDGTMISAIPIKETVSEDSDPEEEKIDTMTHRSRRTSSEIVDS